MTQASIMTSQSGAKRKRPQDDEYEEERRDEKKRRLRQRRPVMTAIPPWKPACRFVGEKKTLDVLKYLNRHGVPCAAVDLVMFDGIPTLRVVGRAKPKSFEKDLVPYIRKMILRDLRKQIPIVFEDGTEERGCGGGGGSPPNSYFRRPTCGASVGVEGSSTSCGTLGGFLRITKGTRKGEQLGLTCLHVISDMESNQQTTTLNDSPITIPSAPDHKSEIKQVGESMISAAKEYGRARAEKAKYGADIPTDEKLKYKRYQDRMGQRMQDLTSMNIVAGKVVASSGSRVHEGEKSPMDWAAVRMENTRLGENIIFSQPDAPSMFARGIFKQARDCIVKGAADPLPGESVLKVGRTTGCTYGRVNGIRNAAILDTAKTPTSEYVVLGNDGVSFSEPGDSGAWVINTKGEVVGVVTGGNNGVSYIKPIKTILKDISKETGLTLALA